ncbi:MAG TPA: TSUP family transporter [Candidatus Saccharimonadales bacterium]|nr:TSUP family transporter [Candidatus Saccharimonadales bacterium]
MNTIVLVLIGLAAGVLSGLVGVGGGIIVVPALVLLMGFSQKTAQGTTLLMLVLPVGAFAATAYYRAGLANVRAAVIIALGFIVGAAVAARIAIKLPDHAVGRIFGGLLLAVAIKLLLFGK